MRDYAKVAPTFWTGKTGRAMRGNLPEQILALYLMSSPHASMTGIYHCPVVYMAHETGMPLGETEDALRGLIERGFCTYDAEDELVWVCEMARFQIGEELREGDRRIIGIERELDQVPNGNAKRAFLERYKAPYRLGNDIPEAPSKGDVKPLRSQEQAQEQEQAHDIARALRSDGRSEYEIEFDDRFWPAWQMNRVGEAAARREYGKARRAGATADEIVGGAKRYQAQKPEWQQWKAPANWLSGGHWHDEPAKPDAKAEQPAKPMTFIATDDPRWPDMLTKSGGDVKPLPNPKDTSQKGNWFPDDWLVGLMPPMPATLKRTAA